MKPITTSIYDFPRLITEGRVYVDKTASLREPVKIGWSPTKTGGRGT